MLPIPNLLQPTKGEGCKQFVLLLMTLLLQTQDVSLNQQEIVAHQNFNTNLILKGFPGTLVAVFLIGGLFFLTVTTSYQFYPEAHP